MQDRLLLYIDILGFSDLVAGNPARIDDLYEVIASLNAHKHDAFKCVIFSDTILVYNVDGGDSPQDLSYLLMFMCEFAKDLMHRLTNRNIVYRAVITWGEFRHYQLNDVPCFYGTSLVNAYQSEKTIKAIGLFLDQRLLPYCNIFSARRYNDEFYFVFVTQGLDRLELNKLPMPAHYLEDTDLNWDAGPELLHLTDLLRGSMSELPESVVAKYRATVELYKLQYPKIVALLEANNFDISAVSPGADWQKVIDRHPEDCSYAIKTRTEF